jgi:tyrosine-protein phosphatase SIW14
MPPFIRWSLGLVLAASLTAVPVVHYRWVYTHGKRLREVAPGVLYRSGQMTAAGFTEAVHVYHIRTIINLQDEYPDPDVYVDYFSGRTIKESQMCRSLGVRYVFLPPDLIPRRQVPANRPAAIDRFLRLLDEPASFPILIHCRAGLHRTGVMTAVYRLEHDGWTPRETIAELKENGFGEWPCTSANDYITEYILTYERGVRRADVAARTTY